MIILLTVVTADGKKVDINPHEIASLEPISEAESVIVMTSGSEYRIARSRQEVKDQLVDTLADLADELRAPQVKEEEDDEDDEEEKEAVN